MDLNSWLLFVFTFFSVLILPGPNAAFAVGQSVRYGFLGSLPVSLGFMTATGLHAIIALSGLGLLIKKYVAALIILKWLGVLYLLYLAHKAITTKPAVTSVESLESSKYRMYFSAVFVSLTNPKALLASLMLYPLFMNQGLPMAHQFMILAFTAMAISLSIYGAYGLAANALRNRLLPSARSQKLTGLMYLGAAGALASKQT